MGKQTPLFSEGLEQNAAETLEHTKDRAAQLI